MGLFFGRKPKKPEFDLLKYKKAGDFADEYAGDFADIYDCSYDEGWDEAYDYWKDHIKEARKGK